MPRTSHCLALVVWTARSCCSVRWTESREAKEPGIGVMSILSLFTRARPQAPLASWILGFFEIGFALFTGGRGCCND
jgi:hypothetical protein